MYKGRGEPSRDERREKTKKNRTTKKGKTGRKKKVDKGKEQRIKNRDKRIEAHTIDPDDKKNVITKIIEGRKEEKKIKWTNKDCPTPFE